MYSIQHLIIIFLSLGWGNGFRLNGVQLLRNRVLLSEEEKTISLLFNLNPYAAQIFPYLMILHLTVFFQCQYSVPIKELVSV